MSTRHELNPTLQREFLLSVLAGEPLGWGMGRKVFALEKLYDSMPELVIKIEDGDRAFQNVVEWDTWQQVKGTKWAKWLAPCEWISQCGSILVMRRTEIIHAKDYPTKLPKFLTDCKRSNYGRLQGRFVCHDYGTNLATTWGLSDRMRSVKWYDT